MNIRHPSPAWRTTGGFTLIELLIVVVILGIIASIAYPSYQEHIIRTNRSAAKACILEHAQFLERFYTTRMTYAGANPALACRTNGNLNQRYTIAVGNLTATTYTITAVPQGSQLRDTECGTLSLNQAGTRGETGTGTVATCW